MEKNESPHILTYNLGLPNVKVILRYSQPQLMASSVTSERWFVFHICFDVVRSDIISNRLDGANLNQTRSLWPFVPWTCTSPLCQSWGIIPDKGPRQKSRKFRTRISFEYTVRNVENSYAKMFCALSYAKMPCTRVEGLGSKWHFRVELGSNFLRIGIEDSQFQKISKIFYTKRSCGGRGKRYNSHERVS